jgi:hypothetical protein
MQGFLFLLQALCLNFAKYAADLSLIAHHSLAKYLISNYNLILIEKSNRLGVANA